MDAVLEGRSLPGTLAELTGRSRSVLRHASTHATSIPDVVADDYRLLLQVVEGLDVGRRPVIVSQWQALSRLVQASRAHGGLQRRPCSDVLVACILEGARHLALGPRGDASAARGLWHKRLKLAERLDPKSVSAAMLDAHVLLTGCDLPPDPFRNSVRAAQGESSALWVAQAIASVQLDRLMCAWQRVMPLTVPVSVGCHVFETLADPAAVVRYGEALENCLVDPSMALRYLVDACLLVGVSDAKGRPVGMVSIRISQDCDSIAMKTLEVAGPRNEPADDALKVATRKAIAVLHSRRDAFGEVLRFSQALALCRQLG
jgi:hypothetical protein